MIRTRQERIDRLDPMVVRALCAGMAVVMLSGCNNTAKEVVKSDYKVALNQYYQGYPRCIWPDSVAAPVETADPAEKAQLDALVTLGLMQREAPARGAGRKVAKPAYDLTPAGKDAWTPDVLSPGAGNFCYGRPQVIAVDRSRRNTPSSDIVDFHYAIPDPPAWSKSDAAQSAFPEIKAELAGPHYGQAVLVDTTDGYRVHGAPKIVEPTADGKPPKRHLIRKILHKLRSKV